MNKQMCENEKWSSRTVGLIILPFALVLSVIGFLMLPFIGLFFSLPFVLLACVLIAAPESRVCRLILGRNT
ncbi:MAG: hypothetical protein HKM93_20410 [Desulfobacteraceae bacterium]|nr:hypothetical protein [Desulfobacteraceae bacterium]